jgi:hypothetical protein
MLLPTVGELVAEVVPYCPCEPLAAVPLIEVPKPIGAVDPLMVLPVGMLPGELE